MVLENLPGNDGSLFEQSFRLLQPEKAIVLLLFKIMPQKYVTPCLKTNQNFPYTAYNATAAIRIRLLGDLWLHNFIIKTQ